MTEENKKPEEQVLFPEVSIGKYTIKPWSFGVLFSISELLEQVLDKMEEKNLMNLFEGDFISYISMAKVFTIASPQVLKIVSITLDEEEEEIKKLSMEDGIKIAVTIYSQNIKILKNVLAPLLGNLENPEEVEENQESSGEKETK